MTEMKDILKAAQESTELVKEMKERHTQEIETVRKEMDDLAARAFRPGFSATAMEGKTMTSDPELKAFIAKGTMPTTERKELSVENNGQGVTVRGEWSDRIFKLVRESSPFRSVASVMQTSSNALEVLVDREEPNSEWTDELSARTKTDASFVTRHPIAVSEHYALPEATLQMLEDSSLDIEAWLQSKIARRFARQEATAFMLGDGIDKPRGILTYDRVPDADHTWGADPDAYTIGATYTGVDGGIDTTDTPQADALFDLVDSLKADYLPGASWMMTRAFRNQLRKLKTSDGHYLYHVSLANDLPDTLLGYPVALAEDMPAPGADEVGALFGNFREAYTIVDRIGLSIQRDSISKPGWVRMFARKRVGGALTNPEAVKALVLGSEPA